MTCGGAGKIGNGLERAPYFAVPIDRVSRRLGTTSEQERNFQQVFKMSVCGAIVDPSRFAPSTRNGPLSDAREGDGPVLAGGRAHIASVALGLIFAIQFNPCKCGWS